MNIIGLPEIDEVRTGECPNVPNFDNCTGSENNGCLLDGDCDSGLKCCFNGCSMGCSAPATTELTTEGLTINNIKTFKYTFHLGDFILF